MSAFVLNLETLASPDDLQTALKDFVEIANRLNLSVKTKIINHEIMACPGDNYHVLHFVLTKAIEKGSKISPLMTSHSKYFSS